MEALDIFTHAPIITGFVFAMMLLIDFVDTVSNRRRTEIIQGGLWPQKMPGAKRLPIHTRNQ